MVPDSRGRVWAAIRRVTSSSSLRSLTASRNRPAAGRGRRPYRLLRRVLQRWPGRGTALDGAWLGSAIMGGFELGSPAFEPVAPYLVRPVNRAESPPDRTAATAASRSTPRLRTHGFGPRRRGADPRRRGPSSGPLIDRSKSRCRARLGGCRTLRCRVLCTRPPDGRQGDAVHLVLHRAGDHDNRHDTQNLELGPAGRWAQTRRLTSTIASATFRTLVLLLRACARIRW